jgi:hypothetical protein
LNLLAGTLTLFPVLMYKWKVCGMNRRNTGMRNIRLLLMGVVLLALTGGAYFWGNAMVEAFYTYRSPLKDDPPQPGETLYGPVVRRVVFVLIDGLRVDTALNEQVMPNLSELRRQGAWAVMHSRPPSYSSSAYSVLLTGAWPDLSDGPPFNLDYDDIHPISQDQIFAAASRAGLRTALSAYYWFEKMVPQDNVAAGFYTAGEDHAADRAVVDAALEGIRQGGNHLTLVHLDQVDHAGHYEGGPRDPRWNEAAGRADSLLGEIWAELDLNLDTLLVLSDHGHIDRGGHGGNEPVVLTEPFILAGAAVKPGEYGPVQMVDVAPTIAALLGTNIPASSQGKALIEMLELGPERERLLAQQFVQQQEGLYQKYAQAMGFTPGAGIYEDSPVLSLVGEGSFAEAMQVIYQVRLHDERTARLTAPLIFFTPPIFLIIYMLANRRKLFAWTAVGLAVYHLVFHLVYAVLGGRTYSWSSVASAGDIVTFGALAALVSLLVGWTVYAWGIGLLKGEPVRAAEKTFFLAFGIIYILSIQVMLSYILNGPWAAWALPEPVSYFRSFLALVQILFVGAFSLLFAVAAALGASLLWRRNERGRTSSGTVPAG